jgi:RNA polymerase primary sigma factor
MSTKTERLTQQEELALLADKDNKKSLDKLVLANLGLVHKITHHFPIKNSNCGYDDLFQEGVAGLMHAIDKFEPARGYRLSTYSYRWIQAYVSRYYQNQGRTIRVPVHMSTKQLQLNKQVEALTSSLGRTPTEEEITAANSHAESIRSATMTVSSLNSLIGESEELECLQGEDRTEQHDTEMECELLLDKVRDQVSERDFTVLLCRYGLCGVPQHTLSEISEKQGVTRARIHQIERNMLKLLREAAV